MKTANPLYIAGLAVAFLCGMWLTVWIKKPNIGPDYYVTYIAKLKDGGEQYGNCYLTGRFSTAAIEPIFSWLHKEHPEITTNIVIINVIEMEKP